MATPKEAAKQLIEHMPNEATWEDILYELYVRNEIEKGLSDVEAGRTIPHEQVVAEFLRK